MTDLPLYFGWRVALLAMAVAQLLVLAGAVATQATHVTANRLLAGFLVVLAGVVTPYAIGFAGAYDVWRWLTFAPFAIPLALPPLLHAYAHALVAGRLPSRFGLHLTLPVGQAAYFVIAFLMPMDAKWAWYTGAHRAVMSPLFDAMLMVSLAAYAWATLALLKAYRLALAEQRSDGDRFATGWLRRVVLALVATLSLYLVFAVWDTISGGIDFFQETGLYLALCCIGLYLGVEGWRHAGLRFPVPTPPAPVETVAGPDWRAVAADYDARLRGAGWATEPDLSLATLSRRLGTNTGRLSRAINLGLGVNFSAWINGVRAEAVARALDAGSREDLLGLALDAGFSSKASFNRAFQARFGLPPSRYRRDVSHHESSTDDAEMRRAAG